MRVFSTYKYIEWLKGNKKTTEDFKARRLKEIEQVSTCWERKLDGKTNEEIDELGYYSDYDWEVDKRDFKPYEYVQNGVKESEDKKMVKVEKSINKDGKEEKSVKFSIGDIVKAKDSSVRSYVNRKIMRNNLRKQVGNSRLRDAFHKVWNRGKV